MIFFLNGDGTMSRQDGTRIFQGSNNVTEIQVMCMFAPPTALQLSFTLPNGLITVYKPMEYKGQFTVSQKKETEVHTGVYYWSIPITDSVTVVKGTVGVSVNVVNVQSTSNKTSYTATFEVEYSALPLPPDPPPTTDEWQQLIDLLNAYYAQNADVLKQNQELIESILGDYTEVIARLDRAESDIEALQKQTGNPLLGDFTYDAETGVATKYFKDGTTATIQFPRVDTRVTRSEYMSVITFKASQFVDGELAIGATVSGLKNDKTVISVESKSGEGYAQTANSIFKGSDGSLLLSGVAVPFDGRLVIMISGGAGTAWHEGTLLNGRGEQKCADEGLRSSAVAGDIYLNTETEDLYRCTEVTATDTTWEWITNIRGMRGVSITGVGGGESVDDGDYTVTPITVTYDEGEPTRFEVKAKNGKVGVLSVNGMSGEVSMDKESVGLGSVDNTSDADKPVSAATQSALNKKIGNSGSQSIKGDLTVVAGGSATGSVVVQGDLTVKGTTVTKNQESLVVVDNIIVTNSKAAPLSDLSGLVIRTDEIKSYGIVYDPTGNAVKLGEGGLDANNKFTFNDTEGKPVAVRDDENKLTDGDLMQWDSADKKLTDSGKSTADFATAAQGAKADSAYQKPSAGIPGADMDTEVQVSLEKVNTSIQYVEQTLTEGQKATARNNIGAARASGTGFKAVAFTESSWAAQSDGTYTLTLTATQTGTSNNKYIATVEKSENTDFVQLADALIKGTDGSLRVQGVTAAYAGRIVIILI